MKTGGKTKTRNSQSLKAPEIRITSGTIGNVRADIAAYSAEPAKPENREAGKKAHMNISPAMELQLAREAPVQLLEIRNLDVIEYRNTYWVNLDTLCVTLGLDAKTEREKVQSDPDFIWMHNKDDGITIGDACNGLFYIDASQVCGWLFTISRASVGHEYQMPLTMYRRRLQAAVNASCAVLKSSATVDRDAERRLKALQEVSAKQAGWAAELLEISGKQAKLGAELRALSAQMIAKPVRAEHADREA